MRARRIIVLCLGLVLLLASAAQGAPLSPELRRLQAKMERHFKRKAFKEAAQIALQLYEKTKKAQFLANAALCFDLSVDDERALDLYRRFLAERPNAKNKNTIVERIQFLRNRHSLKKREVTFLSEPSGASVVVTQGARTIASGKTPVTSWVPFGTFRVRISRRGYKVVERNLVVAQGPPLTLDQKLTPTESKGTLALLTTPRGATVRIDGAIVGRTPLDGVQLSEGTHRLRVELAGYRPIERPLVVNSGHTTRLALTLTLVDRSLVEHGGSRTRSKGRLIGAWTMLGGGAALAIVGSVLHVLARKKISDANSQLDATPFANRDQAFIDQILGKERDAKRLNKVAIGLIAGGSAVLVGGVIWVVLEYRRGQRERLSERIPRVEPIIVPRGAMVQLRWGLP